MDQQNERIESLGPAERIVGALTEPVDHMFHGRTGVVIKDAASAIGVKWYPALWKDEDGVKNVYQVDKIGKRSHHRKIGKLNGTMDVKEGRHKVAVFRQPGIFPEVAEHMYRKVADVYELDNEFAARWASWAFEQDHKDLKVVLAAFMLVQSRMGEPEIVDGKIEFYDDDFRNVGEAMCLIRKKKVDLSPKMLLRVGDVINLPGVAKINRKLGFGVSTRNPARGRYYKVVEKWLRYREDNLPMLEGLVKAGFKGTVKKLARRVGYKPTSPKFFEVLGWKQSQSKDGRREMAIGEAWEQESWEGKTEEQICKIITKEKPSWKVVAGMLPKDVGMTRAIVAAAVEAGSMSDKDLVIMTPTLEELGLIKVASVKKRWEAALKNTEDRRAENIARNVKSQDTKAQLEIAADRSSEKAMEEATRDLRIYVLIDISSSMGVALDKSKEYLPKLLAGFPLERTHVAVFNSMGKEVILKSSTRAGVANALKGYRAGGMTSHSAGIWALRERKPKEGEDALMIFIGDQGDNQGGPNTMAECVGRTGFNPVAFGMLHVGDGGAGYVACRSTAVVDTAALLGIPCFDVDENMFRAEDPYAITRLLRNLIASTPVGQRPVGAAPAKRKSLVEQILETDLLQKPVWA
jgi:hypothetical protein